MGGKLLRAETAIAASSINANRADEELTDDRELDFEAQGAVWPTARILLLMTN